VSDVTATVAMRARPVLERRDSELGRAAILFKAMSLVTLLFPIEALNNLMPWPI
jgi:hypothetical protein